MLYHKLEQRIAERTAELSRANEYLQKEIIERKHAEEELKAARDELELRVRERTADLTESNKQLNQEIIERERVQEALRKTAEEWSTTFDSTKDIIILIDSENRVIRANSAGRAFFHLPSNDSLHKPLEKIFQSSGMHKDIEPLSAMKKSKKREESNVHFPEKNIWISFTADPIFDSSKKMLGAICIIRDITDRMIAQEEKSILESQLMQIQKMDSIGRLAGGIAHDFNNLLSAIIGYSFISAMKLPEDSPAREYMKKITETGERAAALTHQLLAFSRKQILEMKSVDLIAIATNLEKMLSRLIGENIRIEIKSTSQEEYIKADSVQIEQVIMNLAVNARDAMPNGGILTIDISDIRIDQRTQALSHDIPPGPYIKMSVTDTGEGMSNAVKEKIFEPFFTTKEIGKGTGMGLATVYGIVRQHKGYIFVHSRPGMGSTFYIYFPAVRKDQLDRSEIGQEDETLLGGNETILVVDDEPMICDIVEETLQPLGYRVLLASNGDEALEACQSVHGNINLLLTDVIMPGLNGRELAERFLQKRPDTKVIYMSGYTDEVIGRHGVLEPGIIFLHKPLSPLTLTRKIREVLDVQPAI
jgi:PAS domain S-box-containing protein